MSTLEKRYMVTDNIIEEIQGFICPENDWYFQEVDTTLKPTDKEYLINRWHISYCFKSFEDAKERALNGINFELKQLQADRDYIKNLKSPEDLDND